LLRITPRYLEMLDPTKDRTRRLFERLGISSKDLDSVDGISLGIDVKTNTYSRLLTAYHLLDLTLRLQPLVSDVFVEGLDEATIRDLGQRFPCEVSAGPPVTDVVIAVGNPSANADASVDAAGWTGAFGSNAGADDDHNPFGALAFAGLAAGEVFKLAFLAQYPTRNLAKRFVLAAGPFSFWDYSRTSLSPTLEDVELAAVLVGVGGVGAAVINAFGELGPRLSGTITLVDPDHLDIYNLNRTLYATVEEAVRGELKVVAAARSLASRSAVETIQVGRPYRDFAMSVGTRSERRFSLVISGVDRDDIRWEVQRDLPLVLIDGATGSQANCRVERIRFAEAGCLGCSRPPQGEGPMNPDECDAPPDPVAPSISFVSALAGTLAAAEAVKSSLGTGGLAGYFEHSFVYPPNPEMTGIPARRSDCPVGCSDPRVIDAFHAKWAN